MYFMFYFGNFGKFKIQIVQFHIFVKFKPQQTQQPFKLLRMENPSDMDLFNLALNEEADHESLLSYYRQRILDFDKERSEFLERFEQVRFSQEEKHQLEWDLKRKTEESNETKRIVEESKLLLYEERTRNLELKRENTLLRVKEQKDRKKLEELISITQPVEQDIILRKDIRPDVKQKIIHGEKRRVGSGAYGPGRTVLKTIYLPNEQLNTLGQENLQLKNQLKEMEELHRDQVAELKRQVEHHQTLLTHARQNSEIKCKNILEKNQKLEKLMLNTNKEYFSLRRQNTDRISSLQEENSLLRQKNINLANEYINDKSSIMTKNAAIHQVLEKKTQDYAHKCQNITGKKDAQLSILKDQYFTIQKVYLGKIKTLQRNLVTLAEKYKSMETRKSLEIQGYKTQIKNLKAKTFQLQNLVILAQQQGGVLDNVKMMSGSFKRKLGSGSKKHKTKKFNVKKPQSESFKKTKGRRGKAQNKENQTPEQREDLQEEEQESLNEDLNESESVSSLDVEELEILKNQLTNLEQKLDGAKKQGKMQF